MMVMGEEDVSVKNNKKSKKNKKKATEKEAEQGVNGSETKRDANGPVREIQPLTGKDAAAALSRSIGPKTS